MVSRREFLNRAKISSALLCLSQAQNSYSFWSQKEEEDLQFSRFSCNFPFKILRYSGSTMNDGIKVPNKPDGMGIFYQENGNIVLLINHELSLGILPKKSPLSKAYDSYARGGVTRLELDEYLNVIDHRLVLAGTMTNCNGGVTPWGSWITCEENTKTSKDSFLLEKKHGYAFEVYPNIKEPQIPIPLKDMGRFKREAVGIDPETGFVYQTEDRLESCFYRFRPNTYGKLRRGGTLEALKVKGTLKKSMDDYSFESINQKIEIEWIEIDHKNDDEDNLRKVAQSKGASIFSRGEGITLENGELFFTCTSGGPYGIGQVFKLNLKEQTLELEYVAKDENVLHMPDNLVISPSGDLIICEDRAVGSNRLLLLKKSGEIIEICKTKFGEFAGPVFSKDGKTLFVNHLTQGKIIAIDANW